MVWLWKTLDSIFCSLNRRRMVYLILSHHGFVSKKKSTYFVICLSQMSASLPDKWGRTKEGSTYWSGLTCARGGTSLSQISKAATASIGQWTPTRKVQEGSWEAKDFDWWYANCLGKGVAWSKIRGRWYYICSFFFLSTPYLFNNIDIWQ